MGQVRSYQWRRWIEFGDYSSAKRPFSASVLRWVPNRTPRPFQIAWASLLSGALVLNIIVYRQRGWTWPTDVRIFLLAIVLVLSLFRYGTGWLPLRDRYCMIGCGICGILLGALPTRWSK